MTLMIDTSQALLQPAALHRLVCAVEAGQHEDEAEWVEWKSRLDLREKKAHVKLACQIVGMANRRVTEAARFAEGFAYVLVGIEPGSRCGVARVDLADLRPAIERYLGFDGPRWTARYDTADGTSVLVIIVYPPQYGDPIHRIVREFEGVERGAIFVRKGAQTVGPDPGDLDYLTSRAARQADRDFVQWSTDAFPPSAAGVHRAAGPGTGTAKSGGSPPDQTQPGEWWELPPYIPRDHDAALRDRMAAAACDGGFVLVTGRSCTGKTRSVWEAVRSEAFRGWRLARPAGARQLRSVALSDRLQPGTIVWLDEMQLFLSADDGDGLTADDLRALWTRHRQVVVVGTMWPDLYDDMVFGFPRRGDSSFDRARQVLGIAGDPVRVPDQLAGPELDRAREKAWTDDTIRWALRSPDYGVTQVLAGVPWLVQHWEQPRSSHTKSVLAAAAAAARLGIREPVSVQFLREAARAYFPSRRAASPDWFASSIAEATELIRDAVSALIPEPDPADDNQVCYRLTDYLLQYNADGRGVEPVPESVWHALITQAIAPSQRLSLVRSAGQRLLYGLAEPLLMQALDAGYDWARRELVSLRTLQGRYDEAVEHERADPHGSSSRLADLLDKAGRLDELRDLARTDRVAAAVLQREEREDQSDQASRAASDPERTRLAAIGGLVVQGLAGELCTLAEDGNPAALYWAVDLLANQGRTIEAFDLAARHETEQTGARCLWELLARNARAADTVTDLHQRVGNDRQNSEGLAGILFGPYRDETMRLAQEDPHVLVNLSFLLHASGRTQDAIGHLRDSGTEDPCQCPATALATLLADTGQVDEATALLRPIRTQFPWGQPFRPKHVDELLAKILRQHRREDELEAMAEESASARREWAHVLAARNQIEAAAGAFRSAALWLVDHHPLVEMGLMLADHGEVERAFQDVGGYSEQIFGRDYRPWLAAGLAGQGRLEELRQATAAGQSSARVYLNALLAAECTAADLARQTVSGDRDAADALILLAVTGYLDHAVEFRQFGLRPDGTIALGQGRDEWTVPSTLSKPQRAVLLGSLTFLNYG
jgi:hypothetical protein